MDDTGKRPLCSGVSDQFLQLAVLQVHPRYCGDLCITKEAPLAVQEVPGNAAKARPVMTGLKKGITITGITDAALVLPFIIRANP